MAEVDGLSEAVGILRQESEIRVALVDSIVDGAVAVLIDAVAYEIVRAGTRVRITVEAIAVEVGRAVAIVVDSVLKTGHAFSLGGGLAIDTTLGKNEIDAALGPVVSTRVDTAARIRGTYKFGAARTCRKRHVANDLHIVHVP